jgi:basic amino acid/polyamine antiporter, APA family
VLDRPLSFGLMTTMGAALVPVLFAYGGWQTSSFVAAELRRPERDLPRGLLLGVSGVILLYLAVNAVSVRALGPEGLAATTTPASTVMRLALGERGASLIAAGIAISTLGFLSQGILTAPRVYYAMAEDGLFFRPIAAVHARYRTPYAAILLATALGIGYISLRSFEQLADSFILGIWPFYALAVAAVFVLRRRGDLHRPYRTWGYPITPLIFLLASVAMLVNAAVQDPMPALIGVGLIALGVPVFYFWKRPRRELFT